MHKPNIYVTTHKLVALLLLTLVMTATTAATVQAQSSEDSDFKAPILIDSDKQHIDLKENKTIFDGNVLVKQGSMSMHAEKVLAYRQNEKGKEVFVATGNPAVYKRILTNGKPIEAQANTIRYEVETRSLVLTGNAQLTQNDSKVIGKTIRYDLVKQTLEAAGSDGTRVQSIFNTEDSDDQDSDQDNP